MKYLGLLVVALIFVGCTALDKEATRQNYWNVNKITHENEDFIEKSDLVDSIKDAKNLRNAESRIQAWEMAKTAGNDESPSELEGIGQRPQSYILSDPADIDE